MATPETALDLKQNGSVAETSADDEHVWEPPTIGFVYFVQAEDGGLIKIGWTQRPRARLRGIQTGSPTKLRYLLVFRGSQAMETKLHARFAHLREHGEWFRPAPELVEFIEDESLTPRVGSRKRKLPYVLTRDEVRLLLSKTNVRCPTGLRDRCMFELMYRAGMRVGEVVNLRPRDIDITGGVVRIHDGKGGDGTAYFDSESLRGLLEQWRATRRALPKSEFFFCTLRGQRVDDSQLRHKIKLMAKRAGLDPKRISPHKLRHTFATELLDEGFTIREVQEALRHAQLSTTEIYTHVLDSNLRAKIQRRVR